MKNTRDGVCVPSVKYDSGGLPVSSLMLPAAAVSANTDNGAGQWWNAGARGPGARKNKGAEALASGLASVSVTSSLQLLSSDFHTEELKEEMARSGFVRKNRSRDQRKELQAEFSPCLFSEAWGKAGITSKLQQLLSSSPQAMGSTGAFLRTIGISDGGWAELEEGTSPSL